MRENKERALGTQNECKHCEHFEKYTHLFSLAFIYFKTCKRLYGSIPFNKKSSTFKDQKPISSTFKALEIGPLNSKGIQDAYELRNEKY